MTIGATAVWRVRTGGNNANGGGYDAGIASAGTDYSQQDAAQLSVSDAVTIGTTTVTSVTGGFTAAMIGNAAWISGTGVTAGPYFITAVASTNSITVDRSPGTGTGGTLKVGGGWADPATNISGSSNIKSGNVIFIRAGGSGSVASPDYSTNFISTPSGDTTNGRIKFIGENGRPFIKGSSGNDAIFFNGAFGWYENLYLIANGTAHVNGLVSGTQNIGVNVIFDQNGNDTVCWGCPGSSLKDCEVLSSTANAGSAGSLYAVDLGAAAGAFGSTAEHCNIHDCWGLGVRLFAIARIHNSIIAKCKGIGVVFNDTANSVYHYEIRDCTIDGNGSHGVDFSSAFGIAQGTVTGCLITNNGGYGLHTNSGTQAANDRIRGEIDYNSYFNNSSGNALNLTVGTSTVNGTVLHDNVGTDPQYTAQSTENYAIGTNLKALGGDQAAFLQSIGTNTSGVTSYLDPGAVQRQEAGGGSSSMVVHPGMTGGARG